MAPPFDFTIPDGKNAAGEFFPQSLTKAIKTWLEERNPSGKNGRFVFDISVYSSLGEAKLPVYRASNLPLRLEDIKPKEARDYSFQYLRGLAGEIFAEVEGGVTVERFHGGQSGDFLHEKAIAIRKEKSAPR